MQILSGALLLACVIVLWSFVRNDVADYAAFKLLTETDARQKRYRVWILKSFLLFFGLSMTCLALLGRLRTVMILPPEFHMLSESIQLDSGKKDFLNGTFVGVLAGGICFGAGLLIGVILARKAAHKPNSLKLKYLGDIEPLMPRNWQESMHTALLSVNAGLSEELFFRLLLPLLVMLLLGNAVFAFVAATLIFGGVHYYQGPVGVLATTVLGFIFATLYLWTGSLLVPICMHIFVDLMGTVVRPAFARLSTAKPSGTPAQ